MNQDQQFIWKSAGIAGFIATLCCLSPLVLVLFGLSSASLAIGLGDVLFKQYWWVFVGVGLLTMIGAVVMYLRKRYNVCTLDQARRQKKKIINLSLLALGGFIVAYIIFELVLQAIWSQIGWSSRELFWSALGL